MRSPSPTTLRRTAGVLILLALASGCGIRPTAVPVDAGAPASRTACPTAPHVPTALATPTPPGPSLPPARSTAKPGPSPSPAPSTTVTPPPADNVFSALPTATANACR
ncbi:hypothetical protein [Kitasatospora aureofaciens]|uniref:hypothetical protein n=1 Tax=Kitasatospora aureofaciens TaxID=1894 RepID=UPI001C45F100|nr:hypothetical protein [Kitasatospora aureofaciens]MBV6696558.1 hypothetical protein [Kitasatospora aureofaciens]